jgi:hypothetical protein
MMSLGDRVQYGATFGAYGPFHYEQQASLVLRDLGTKLGWEWFFGSVTPEHDEWDGSGSTPSNPGLQGFQDLFRGVRIMNF